MDRKLILPVEGVQLLQKHGAFGDLLRRRNRGVCYVLFCAHRGVEVSSTSFHPYTNKTP